MTAAPQVAAPYKLELDHGVLVVSLQLEAITNEALLDEIAQQVFSRMPEASTAVLFDCHRLVGRVTSQFLAMLVAVRRRASQQGLFVCVCSLNGPVCEAYRISCLDRIIPAYNDRDIALSAVGQFDGGERFQRTLKRKKQEAKQAEAAPPATWRDRIAALSHLEGNARIAMVAGAGLLVGGVIVFATWQAFSDPTAPPPRRSTPQENAAVAEEDGIQIEGEVSGPSGPEAGAWIIAWPAGDQSHELVAAADVRRYFNMGAVGRFEEPDLYAARALPDGKFSIRLGEPTAYHVLVVSQQQTREGALRGDDGEKLEARFADPIALIGKNGYQLSRQQLKDGSALTLNIGG